MNFKTFSKFIDFLPPEFLHSLFISFLKTQIYKKNDNFEKKNGCTGKERMMVQAKKIKNVPSIYQLMLPDPEEQ